jgi:hypothetical protein
LVPVKLLLVPKLYWYQITNTDAAAAQSPNNFAKEWKKVACILDATPGAHRYKKKKVWGKVACILLDATPGAHRYSVYLLAKCTRFTCFAGTKVQLLMQQDAESYFYVWAADWKEP